MATATHLPPAICNFPQAVYTAALRSSRAATRVHGGDASPQRQRRVPPATRSLFPTSGGHRPSLDQRRRAPPRRQRRNLLLRSRRIIFTARLKFC
ncbi:hypothetical protein M6B38_304255 [Iris pallida]|uniref:Uncharacterized protein n=1 Tax=Iris pallida TaxID=29817 RepID=A0AAX6GN05_IRIPA|nr:hypothetical protein M6B38_106550 [Iris pallida]KAJ6830080.1 hypothetical protein M6B38_126025 [Iris pallida]KAJ6842045.1 hypothetical protein M6B38_304255 [Iris pallida]